MIVRRAGGGVKDTDDLPAVLGGDGQGSSVFQVGGNVRVESVPTAADGLHRRLDDLAAEFGPEPPLVPGGLGGGVQVSGAEGLLLGIDAGLEDPAVGAQDPPARAVEPADSARLDLEQD